MKKRIFILFIFICFITTLSFSLELYTSTGYKGTVLVRWHNAFQLTNNTGFNETVMFSENGNNSTGLEFMAKMNYLYTVKAFSQTITTNDPNVWVRSGFGTVVNLSITVDGYNMKSEPLIFGAHNNSLYYTEYGGFESKSGIATNTEKTYSMKLQNVEVALAKGGERWDVEHDYLANIILL